MSGNANGKLRVLRVMRMLQNETDAEHGLSMTSIINKLSNLGMTVDRKTIYTDFDTLRQFGFEIQTHQRNPVEYALGNRDFQIDELMLMMDAVCSCRFITQKQCNRISRNIRQLGSEHQRKKLERCIHVDGRVKGRGDHTFANVDAIHEALRCKKKVRFTYWKIGANGKWVIQHDGKPYLLTPVRITYSDSFYYLTAWSDSHESMVEYRIDRMRDVEVLDEPATRRPEIRDHEFQNYDSQYFGRFDGELVSVTLKVLKNKADVIFDRFGKDASITANADGTSLAHVSVRVSPPFFGWIAGLNGVATIQEPKKLVEEYKEYLRKLIDE